MSNIKDEFTGELTKFQEGVGASIATKADLAVVETTKAEVIKHTDEAIDAVKAEAAELKTTVEDLTAKLAAMPSIDVDKKETSMKYTKQITGETGDEFMGIKQDYVAKAYDDNTDVSGGRVDTNGLFFALEAGNFARMYGDLWMTRSGSVKIPVLSGVVFTAETEVNASRNKGGSLAVTIAVVDNLVSENQISKPAVEDIDLFDQKMIGLMMQAAAKKEATDAVAALKSATFTDVNTGSASALPSAANIMGKLVKMKSALSSAYLPGAKWFFSRELMDLVEISAQSTGANLNFNPVTGIRMLLGHEVVVVDYLEAGSTAGHYAGYFGDMKMALAFVSRKNLEIGRYMETSPGHVTYFGDVRSVSAIVDTEALIGLKTAA